MTLPTPVQAVDLARKVISGYGRPDLDARLARTRERLLDERIRVLVVGEFKQGKSFLVNALVSAPACPVHDDIATSVPTVVRHAETPCVSLVRTLEPDGSGVPAEERSELHDVEVADIADRIAEHVLESRNPAGGLRPSYVEVGLPRNILVGGLEIVDTPGVGGLDSVHGAATSAALPSADAVLLVSDASQELTAPELELLRRAAELCPNVACVLTKVDLYPQWRRVAELDLGHLRSAGVDGGLIAVSSAVRWQAVTGGDASLNEESGFPALENYLYERVVTDADRLRRRSTVHDIVWVTDQVLATLRAERHALQDLETAGDLISRLNEAQQRAAALTERSARWQRTLDDGVTDFAADVEGDLRDRVREIIRLAEDEIDENGDPVQTWPQLSGWVERQAAAAASANVIRATRQARLLAERVATRFAEEQEQILPAPCTEACAALSTARGPLGTFAGTSLVDPFAPEDGLRLGDTAPSEERRTQHEQAPGRGQGGRPSPPRGPRPPGGRGLPGHAARGAARPP